MAPALFLSACLVVLGVFALDLPNPLHELNETDEIIDDTREVDDETSQTADHRERQTRGNAPTKQNNKKKPETPTMEIPPEVQAFIRRAQNAATIAQVALGRAIRNAAAGKINKSYLIESQKLAASAKTIVDRMHELTSAPAEAKTLLISTHLYAIRAEQLALTAEKVSAGGGKEAKRVVIQRAVTRQDLATETAQLDQETQRFVRAGLVKQPIAKLVSAFAQSYAADAKKAIQEVAQAQEAK